MTSNQKASRRIQKIFIIFFTLNNNLRKIFYLCPKTLELSNEIIISAINPVNIFYLSGSFSNKSCKYHRSPRAEIPTVYSRSYQLTRTFYFCFMEIDNSWRTSESFILNKPIQTTFIENFMYAGYSFTLSQKHCKKWHKISWKSRKNIGL